MPIDGVLVMTATGPVQESRWLWVAGVVITLLGTTFSAFGLLVQKQSHRTVTARAANRPGRKDPAAERPYWCENQWLLGGAVWLMGNIACFAASSLAPQSLLSCLNVWNIVVALFIGHYVFGELVTTRAVISGGVLVVGLIWAIATGPKHFRLETVETLMQACGNPKTLCLVVVTVAFLVTMAVTSYTRHRDHGESLTCVQFTAVSATFSCYDSVCSRSLASLLATSLHQWQPEFASWFFCCVLVAFSVTSLSQIHFLNRGMQNGDAVIVLPLYMAMSTTGQIVGGGIFFDEFRELSLVDVLCFLPGITIVICGALALAWEGWEGHCLVTKGETEPILANHFEEQASDREVKPVPWP